MKLHALVFFGICSCYSIAGEVMVPIVPSTGDHSRLSQSNPLELSPRRPALDDEVTIWPDFALFSSASEYQWYFNGAPIVRGTNFVFTTEPMSPERLGEYALHSTSPLATNSTWITELLTNSSLAYPDIKGSEIFQQDNLGNLYVLSLSQAWDGPTLLKKYAPDYSLLWSNIVRTDFWPIQHPKAPLKVSPTGIAVLGLPLSQLNNSELAIVSSDGSVSFARLNGTLQDFILLTDGFVVAATQPNGSFLRSYAFTGATNWTFALPGEIDKLGLTLTSEGRIVCAAYRDTEPDHLMSLNTEGALEWTQLIENPLTRTLQAGPDGTVYVIASLSCRKYSARGEILWARPITFFTTPPSRSITPFVVDDFGSVYFVSIHPLQSVRTRLTKLTANGALAWESSFVPFDVTLIALGAASQNEQPVYLIYEASEYGVAAVAKFDSSGIRRWERHVPYVISLGAENREPLAHAGFLTGKRIGLSSSSNFAVVSDLEPADLQQIKVRTVLETIDGGLRARALFEGPVTSRTNRWSFIAPYYDNGRYPILSPPVIANEISFPFVSSATNIVLEADLPNAVLRPPDLDVHAFSSIQSVEISTEVRLQVQTIPTHTFRCLASEDLITWTQIHSGISDQSGKVTIELDRSSASRFFKLISP